MHSINAILFATGLLLLLGIASSKFSARIGMPVLVLFLGVGMLAGSEGIGGIAFEDYDAANRIGTAALAIILFDGGLRTSLSSLRQGWRPALTLSTIGVLVTSALTGLAAAWVLKIPLLHGMLLGGIVGSTDAAAVFSVLRTSGLALPERLTATLKLESGSNDPMAIFLTLGLVGVITGTAGSAGSLLLLFGLQFGVGALAGVGVGYTAAWTVNRSNLDHQGLYPILVTAFGLLAFGLAALLGGSGFLAVYVAGIILGNSPIVFKRGIFHFHDATAWFGQIILFVMLGLLSFPSRLIAVAGQGLLIATALILVARPIAVVISALPFGFRPRELTFLSWVGLKGAVPITLATFPLMAGVPGSELLFDAVFFVVLVSAVLQGWTLPIVARRLRIGRPADPTPPISVEINALRHVDGEIVDYTIAPSARAAGLVLRDLGLPEGVAVTLVVRGGEVIMPRGATAVLPGDHVFIAVRSRLRPFIDRLFDHNAEAHPLVPGLALEFRDRTTFKQLYRFLDMPASTQADAPISSLRGADGSLTSANLGPFSVGPGKEADYLTLTYAPDEESDEGLHLGTTR